MNVEPLKKCGALDAGFAFDDVTPAIGREYPTTNIVDELMNAANADELLRDLAITSMYTLPIIRLRSMPSIDYWS